MKIKELETFIVLTGLFFSLVIFSYICHDSDKKTIISYKPLELNQVARYVIPQAPYATLRFEHNARMHSLIPENFSAYQRLTRMLSDSLYVKLSESVSSPGDSSEAIEGEARRIFRDVDFSLFFLFHMRVVIKNVEIVDVMPLARTRFDNCLAEISGKDTPEAIYAKVIPDVRVVEFTYLLGNFQQAGISMADTTRFSVLNSANLASFLYYPLERPEDISMVFVSFEL